jgi:hypothetical protein
MLVKLYDILYSLSVVQDLLMHNIQIDEGSYMAYMVWFDYTPINKADNVQRLHSPSKPLRWPMFGLGLCQETLCKIQEIEVFVIT